MMRFIDIGGAVHACCDEGPKGQGARERGATEQGAIVFINSLGTDFRIWDAVVPELCRSHRVIRYDKCGHGLSELKRDGLRIEDLAGDLAGLLDRLGVGRVHVVGLSIGGLIAQAFYAAAPQRVASLVLADTAAKIGTHESWTARIEAVRANGVEAIADAVMKLWFTPAFHASRPADLAGYRTMLARTPVAGYIAACEALRAADLRAAAARITAPTLCVVGDADGSTPPALVRELADAIPRAAYEVISGAGHIPCVEQPEALLALIRTHIERAERT